MLSAVLNVVEGAPAEPPSTFWLVRHEDVTGVSGPGVVAQGTEWTSGKVALHWPGKSGPGVTSTANYDSIEDVIAVHGHDGATTIEWVTGPRTLALSGHGAECG